MRFRSFAVFFLLLLPSAARAAPPGPGPDDAMLQIVLRCDPGTVEGAKQCFDDAFDYMQKRQYALISRSQELKKSFANDAEEDANRLGGKLYAEILYEKDVILSDLELLKKRLAKEKNTREIERIRSELDNLEIGMKTLIGSTIGAFKKLGGKEALGEIPWCKPLIVDLAEGTEREDLWSDGRFNRRAPWAVGCLEARLDSVADRPGLGGLEGREYARWIEKIQSRFPHLKGTPELNDFLLEVNDISFESGSITSDRESVLEEILRRAWSEADSFELLTCLHRINRLFPTNEEGARLAARFHIWRGEWEKGCRWAGRPTELSNVENAMDRLRCSVFFHKQKEDAKKNLAFLDERLPPGDARRLLADGLYFLLENRDDFALENLSLASKAPFFTDDPYLRWDFFYETAALQVKPLAGADLWDAREIQKKRALTFAKVQNEMGPFASRLPLEGRYADLLSGK